jgi:hypothetical protein
MFPPSLVQVPLAGIAGAMWFEHETPAGRPL